MKVEQSLPPLRTRDTETLHEETSKQKGFSVRPHWEEYVDKDRAMLLVYVFAFILACCVALYARTRG